ncbi:MAG: PGF-CTERM sorting domain-containing protein [Methanophagales archaeon]|nr:PGF-CTERM sorting domain-containing protein [Methanophagales archaeon]
MIKADDGDGHTDEATVEIVTAIPTPTPVTPTPTATPSPTPPPGFEAVFAIAGLLLK